MKISSATLPATLTVLCHPHSPLLLFPPPSQSSRKKCLARPLIRAHHMHVLYVVDHARVVRIHLHVRDSVNTTSTHYASYVWPCKATYFGSTYTIFICNLEVTPPSNACHDRGRKLSWFFSTGIHQMSKYCAHQSMLDTSTSQNSLCMKYKMLSDLHKY